MQSPPILYIVILTSLFLTTSCNSHINNQPTSSHSSSKNPISSDTNNQPQDTQANSQSPPYDSPDEELESLLNGTEVLVSEAEEFIKTADLEGKQYQEYLQNLKNLCEQGIQDSCKEYSRRKEAQNKFQKKLFNQYKRSLSIELINKLCSEGNQDACIESTRRKKN